MYYPNQTALYQGQLPNQPPLQQRPSIPGRMVNYISEVTPNEVPMDGNPGVFIVNDLSHIYLKKWNSDGTIATINYIPEDANSEEKTKSLEERIQELETICLKLLNKEEAEG